MRKPGFTLVELLVVIVILALLITLGSKGLRTAKLKAKRAQAQIEMRSIETAVMAYFNKYGKLPAATFSTDLEFGSGETGNEELVSVLTVSAGAHDLNPAGIVFLDPQQAGSLRYRDPWGMDYLIRMDTDYDGVILDWNGDVHRKKVILRAEGLHAMTGNPDDYVLSWDKPQDR